MTITEVLDMIEKVRANEYEDMIDASVSYATTMAGHGDMQDSSRNWKHVEAIGHRRASHVLGDLVSDIKKRMKAEEVEE